MATYYVRPDGNNSNTGLGSTAALAWQTFGKAFASGSVVVGGDTVYIAPGTYTENITIAATSPSSEVNIIGDPTASQFSGVNPGFVRLSSFNAAGTLAAFTNTHVIKGTSKNNYTFQNIHFDGNMGNVNQAVVYFVTSRYVKFIKCLFTNNSSNYYEFQAMLWLEAPAATAGDFLVDRCIFGANRANHINFTGKSILADTSTIKDSLFISGKVLLNAATVSVYNCTFVGSPDAALQQIAGSANAYVTVQNCLFLNNLQALSGTSGFNSQTYCRFAGNNTNLSNFASSATSQTTGNGGVDIGYTQLNGLNVLPLFASYASSPNASFGNATGAPLVDLYNKSWSGTSPDAGAVTLSSVSGAGYYLATEPNASTITIAPGSTSQSIELYLGATGLTASTAGLSARYNRTRTASVSIPLVARTIAQAWTAGGFAEVDATNMPGVYRLDLPDAALAAGADDVTIAVRGASGTNGAVMTIKLSSGGLTSAQTASAVWGASPAGYNDATTFGGVVNQIDATVTGTSTLVQDIPSNVWQEQTDDHTTHGTYGYNILRADAPSKEGLVTLHQSGGISRIDADIHAVVNDTAAAAELKGALLHTGGDYISADLLTPVTSAQTVRIGPFAVRTDAGGADGALDLNQSTAGAVVVQLTDAQGTGIDQTSATVQAKVYNVAGGLMATYTCTPAYAVNGFVSIPMTTAVTGTAGSYIINLWSTVGATVIIYGPLQLRVRAI